MASGAWARGLLVFTLFSVIWGQDEADGDACWGGDGRAPENCCISGTSVAEMSCQETRSWLVCLGVLFDPESYPCEYAGAVLARMKRSELVETAGITEQDALRVEDCRGFKSRGVVYSAYSMGGEQGVGLLLELRHSISSLRAVPENQNLGITVIVDVMPLDCGVEPEYVAELADLGVRFHQVDAEGQLHSAFKVRAMLHSPYEHTVYLDTDTEICSDLSDIFAVLPRYDWAAVQAPVLFYEAAPPADPLSLATGVPETVVQYCAAVIAFVRNKRVHRMLALAVKEADRLHPLGYLDQAALRTALWVSRDVRELSLPPNWMCRGAYACSNSVANQVVYDLPRESARQHLNMPCNILHTHDLYKRAG